MPGQDWSGEWAAALSRSPYRAFPVDRSRLVRHWDHISTHYDSTVVEQIDQHLWDMLVQDGTVPGQGKVLDIGCGTGAMTQRFAEHGAKAVGLDISPGMLGLARQRCSALPSVEFMCQDWESFCAGPEYELVLSSFCPAVDDRLSVLKMDALSRGSCYLVSLGSVRGDRLTYDIWEELGHPGMSMEGFDPIYPYYLLKELGREPSLRSFNICEESEISIEDLVHHLVHYFSLFQDVTPEVRSVIDSNVTKRARDGMMTIREERTVSVLRWTALNVRTVS
jgi:SAM-dependent methyltransferase